MTEQQADEMITIMREILHVVKSIQSDMPVGMTDLDDVISAIDRVRRAVEK
jgi:hypothetical protein